MIRHAVAVGVILLSGCRPTADEVVDPLPPPAVFVEEAGQRGIDFVHRSGHAEQFLEPEIMTGGLALFDMDDDGDLDLYLVQAGALTRDAGPDAENRLYRNLGDGHFAAVIDSGAEDRGYGMGVTTGDVDGDGDVDLYVTNVGRNALLRNDGDGRFTDITTEAGVGGDSWSSSAAFVDYDADGDLDLFVCEYLDWSLETEIDCREATGLPDYCGPHAYDAPLPDHLYRNEGNGRFLDVSGSAGIQAALGTGLGVAVGDYDGDGRLDLFVANDGRRNHLWLQTRPGAFVERGLAAGCAVDERGTAKAGMGVGSADLDDDGDLDLLVVNLQGETDSLYRNAGGYFIDATAAARLAVTTRRFTRFGTGFFDFDDDGWLDIYQANGRVRRAEPRYAEDVYAEPNALLRGQPGGLTFLPVAPAGGTAAALIHRSRGAAFGDVDGDGGVDVVVSNIDGPPYLLRNIGARDHAVIVDLRDANGAPALGAVLFGTLGDRRVRRDVQVAYSYASASDPRIRVGLGAASELRDVEVHWPDGRVQVLGTLAADRVYVIGP